MRGKIRRLYDWKICTDHIYDREDFTIEGLNSNLLFS